MSLIQNSVEVMKNTAKLDCICIENIQAEERDIQQWYFCSPIHPIYFNLINIMWYTAMGRETLP